MPVSMPPGSVACSRDDDPSVWREGVKTLSSELDKSWTRLGGTPASITRLMHLLQPSLR